MPNIFELLRKGMDDAATKILGDALVPRNNRYVSVNIKDEYVEFRSAGGNYIEQIEKIKNTMLRYVRVMAVASDPNDAKDEYAKKLYKLLMDANAGVNYNVGNIDPLKLFALYASGNLEKTELKSRLQHIQAKRALVKGPDITWSVLDRYGDVITLVKANSPEEAMAKGSNWEKSNPVSGGARGVRKATSDDLDKFVDKKPTVKTSQPEPTGRWSRWNVYDIDGDVVHAVSARDRNEAIRLAGEWANANNQTLSRVQLDEPMESRPTSLAGYIEESARPFEWNKAEVKPKEKFTEMQLACILGGHEYTGELDENK
jgi:hypothetical protein